MNRTELVEYAKANGHMVTEIQLERWHKNGVLPQPIHEHVPGIAGSRSVYPVFATKNLLLACSSPYQRSLTKMKFDVWIRGGHVETNEIRAFLLNGEFKKISNLVNKIGRNIEAVERGIRPFLKKIKSLIPLPNNDLISLISVQANILSPLLKESIWHADGLEDITGEESYSSLFFRVFKNDLFFAIDNTKQETILDDLKHNLNVRTLEETIKNAPEADFQRAREDIHKLVLLFDAFKELSVYQDFLSIGMKIFFRLDISSYSGMSLACISLLRLYVNERQKISNPGLHLLTEEQITILKQQIMFVQHMKKHKALKRKRAGWIQYFENCDEVTRLDLLNHLNNFTKANPEFLKLLKLKT